MANTDDPILLALSRMQTELNARLDRIDQDVQSLRRTIRESGQESERKMLEVATGFAGNLSNLREGNEAMTRQLGEVLRRLGPADAKSPAPPYSTAADDNDRL